MPLLRQRCWCNVPEIQTVTSVSALLFLSRGTQHVGWLALCKVGFCGNNLTIIIRTETQHEQLCFPLSHRVVAKNSYPKHAVLQNLVLSLVWFAVSWKIRQCALRTWLSTDSTPNLSQGKPVLKSPHVPLLHESPEYSRLSVSSASNSLASSLNLEVPI